MTAMKMEAAGSSAMAERNHITSYPRRQYSAVYEYCVQQHNDMFCLKKLNTKKML